MRPRVRARQRIAGSFQTSGNWPEWLVTAFRRPKAGWCAVGRKPASFGPENRTWVRRDGPARWRPSAQAGRAGHGTLRATRYDELVRRAWRQPDAAPGG